MTSSDPFSRWPERIPAGAAGNAEYVREPRYYARHDWREGAPGAHPVLRFADEGIAVVHGTPEGAAAERLGPVYRLEPGGALAVPTGRVFVRFAEGVEVEDRRAELRQAGYEVVESLGFASHAAWLRAGSGDLAAALGDLAALEGLPEVEAVEPQMLMERGARG